ncbi:MAG: DUF7261 family protein [Halanaeroarchaeum sp.]
MADVDRGQLLIVGALTFAVMLVALAMLLNTAIYTGTVATRDTGTGASEAIEYQGEAETMAAETMATLSTREGESYSELQGNFTDTVDAWSETGDVHVSAALAHGTVEPQGDPARGTLIDQSSDREFTDADTDSNWTVANETAGRGFSMNVSQDSLEEPDDDFWDGIFGEEEAPNYFHVNFTDGSEVYQVYIIRDADDSVTDDVTVNVSHDGSSVGDACSVEADNDRTVVDLTGAEVGGTHCESLETLFEELDDSYTIEYRNGESARGTYSTVVDRPIDQLETGADTDGEDQPTATRALFDAELELTYRSDGVFYRTDLRIAPGAADD